jgi:hypothetical protein
LFDGYRVLILSLAVFISWIVFRRKGGEHSGREEEVEAWSNGKLLS